MPDNAAESLVEQMLVLRCQTGDEPAFTELVERYHRRLRYYLQKMLGSADRADDAAQELWLDVLRSIGKLKEPRAFAPWLYRLARVRAYRELRRPRHPVTEYEVRELPDDAPDFSADDAEEIHRALDQLDAEHREVLLLRFVEEMSYEQIAAVADCELGTVRSRLHYAKRKLKELIQQRNDHDERKRSGIGTAEARR
jgi:RNA polymerase sigma-70 factor (ECF subfamily)